MKRNFLILNQNLKKIKFSKKEIDKILRKVDKRLKIQLILLSQELNDFTQNKNLSRLN